MTTTDEDTTPLKDMTLEQYQALCMELPLGELVEMAYRAVRQNLRVKETVQGAFNRAADLIEAEAKHLDEMQQASAERLLAVLRDRKVAQSDIEAAAADLASKLTQFNDGSGHHDRVAGMLAMLAVDWPSEGGTTCTFVPDGT